MLSPKPWKPERVIWLLGALLASFSLGILIVQGYNWAFAKDEINGPPNPWIMLLGTLVTQGMCLFLVGIFLREHNITWREAFGFASPRRARTLLLAVFTTLIVLPIAWVLIWFSTLILKALSQPVVLQPAVQALQNAVSVSQIVYFGIMAIVCAPIVEEIIFRGIIYPTIKQEGFRRTALWTTSLLFAWSHFNLPTFIPLLFLGMILTFLYETTDNLAAPMLTHSLFNAANYFLMLHNMK
jgi:membrane protease YdiL (CAAX protease family)